MTAAELPFAKWDGEVIVSSTEALSFSSAPEKLVVIGGGYIGLEMGSVWNRLGSEVTVIESNSSICSSMDKDIREKLLMAVLKKQGINFQLESKVISCPSKKQKSRNPIYKQRGKISGS